MNTPITPEVKLERWEDDEFIVTVDGLIVGPTLSEREGRDVLRWLSRSLGELTAVVGNDMIAEIAILKAAVAKGFEPQIIRQRLNQGKS